MKIVIFTHTFYPTISGVATSIAEMGEYLQDRGHEVLVIAPRHQEYTNSQEFRFRVHHTPSISVGVYPDFKVGLLDPDLLQILKDFNPDIIHTNEPSSMGLQGLILAKYLNIPVVSTYHTHYSDREALKAVGLQNMPMMSGVLNTLGKLFRFFYNKHDAVIVPSQDTARELINYGVTPPITVLPSPVDFTKLKSAKKRGLLLRKKYDIQQALIYIGRLSGEKSVDQILMVFQQASKKLPGLQLVLVGDGPAQNDLQSLADELEISEKIIFVGSIPHRELVKEGYYYLGDIFITMSRWETLGLSTIEAMACGLPVVAVRARANIENVQDIGILVDIEDEDLGVSSILKILKNKNYYLNLSELSTVKAREFAPKKIMAKLEKLYQNIIKNKKLDKKPSVLGRSKLRIIQARDTLRSLMDLEVKF